VHLKNGNMATPRGAEAEQAEPKGAQIRIPPGSVITFRVTREDPIITTETQTGTGKLPALPAGRHTVVMDGHTGDSSGGSKIDDTENAVELAAGPGVVMGDEVFDSYQRALQSEFE
jgi:hypothetical protein